ncbi:ATP-binding protein [Candidatus Latescibacterota bacterium]
MVLLPDKKCNKSTILIIDDEECIQDSCKLVLTRAGYSVLTSFDGVHGMSLVREHKPDLVLLDLKLSADVRGEVLIHEIGSIDSSIVIVVITGYANIESAVETMKLGAYDFLPKPFTPDELLLIVNRGLEKKKLLVKTLKLQEDNARIRENFVSIITHEMRSPLVTVEQFIDILLGGFTGEMQPKQVELLSKCKRRIKWLLSLVNEWLDMARMQDTIIFKKFENVNIYDVLYEAFNTVSVQTEKKSISAEFNIPKGLPTIIGNYEALVHLFINLYSNAIKYNRENGKVTTTVCDKGDSISVQVSDTGIGIAQEFIPFIFDEFFRVSTIRKRACNSLSETGTGLGLAIVKKIVDAHKGYISVESQEKCGTCFTVHLPKKQPLSSTEEPPLLEK